MLVVCLILVPLCLAGAQQDKKAPAKDSVNGHYAGTAKNRAEEIIQVTFDLTEKEGVMSGMIRSDHGDFTITGGSHKGGDVTLEFMPTGELAPLA
jgi:outer membrane lipoprotein-sorting protein